MENHIRLHEIYTGEELKTAERIQHLRYLMLVHSRIYYKLNYNLISDKDFDMLAKELKDLQEKNPEIAKKVDFAETFADWDGSTGAFLPLDDEWVVEKVNRIYQKSAAREVPQKGQKTPPVPMEKNAETMAEPVPPVEEPKKETNKEPEEDYQMSLADFFEMEM